MKRLVKTLAPQNQILESDLPKYPIIGFKRCDGKGWAQMTDYKSGNYKLYALGTGTDVSGVGTGNGWGNADTDTLKQVLHWLSDAEVYVFETDRELFKWLAE